ncbi:lipopolysaccharide assembly protein LapA domain-containing protein [Polymorphospora rubra]|uniref:lipopolysaccharide assembly protein LapA domain-containing protein n=1 Tax=Polymorphospora rubra TaxID=338584 RepID=UPI0033E2787C
MKRSRVGGLWVAAVVFAFVLLLLLIFVLQNGQPAEVSFLGAHGTLPMGVALLLAAVFGVLLVALPGTARIVQLRKLDRRPVKQAGPPVPGPTPPPATGIARVPLPPRPPRQDG